MADVTLPEGHPLAGQPCAIFAFLVRHAGGVVLVDTGIGGGHDGIERLYRPLRTPLAEALASAGVRLSGVVAVINTHLHFDHCGENRLFPGTPIYVQQAEYEGAQGPAHTVREWVDFPGARYMLLQGEAEVLPGISVLPTPGHTPGHQSVVVEGGGRRVVIAGQAAYSAEEFACGRADESNASWDAARYGASLRALRALSPDRVYFSHDETVWERSADEETEEA